MRYISFPPIVFETPAPLSAPLAPAPDSIPPEAAVPLAPDSVTHASLTPEPDLPVTPPKIADPSGTMRHVVESAELAQETAQAPERLRRLSELAATESLAPNDPQSRPRFALLNDIAVELRPRRQRARSGQGENQPKPNPTSPPWP